VLKEFSFKPGVVAHACPRTWKLMQGDHKFQASLGYTVRPFLKKKKKKKRKKENPALGRR
jgi:hypothetical protein